MKLFNYSSLNQRETRIYDVGGKSIAGGISVDMLKIVAPATVFGILIGFLLGLPFGINFFNPFSENFSKWWTTIWVALGVGLGCGLYYIQFAGYRLYQYLIAYFRPKKVYKNDWRMSEFKLTNVSIKTFVKKIL